MYHHYLLFLPFAVINDKANATTLVFALNYLYETFVCKSCTTIILCNKVDLFWTLF